MLFLMHIKRALFVSFFNFQENGQNKNFVPYLIKGKICLWQP